MWKNYLIFADVIKKRNNEKEHLLRLNGYRWFCVHG